MRRNPGPVGGGASLAFGGSHMSRRRGMLMALSKAFGVFFDRAENMIVPLKKLISQYSGNVLTYTE
jgi:hypothetical protein